MKYVVEQCVSFNQTVFVEADSREEAFEKACEFIQKNDRNGEELFFEDIRNAFISEEED